MSLKDNYWNHTPVFWKKMGESVRALGMAITGTAIYANNHTAAFISLGATWLGNTIINFATDEGKTSSEDRAGLTNDQK